MSSTQLNTRFNLPTLPEYPESGLTMTRKASKSAPELDRNTSPTTTYNPPTFAPPGFNPSLPKRRLSYAEPPAYKPALESTARKRASSSPLFPSKFSREEPEACVEEKGTPTILTPTVFGKKAQVVYCSTCKTKSLSVTKKKIGRASKFTATILIPAAPLVFLIPHLKDTVHKCPNCRQVMGKHRQRIF